MSDPMPTAAEVVRLRDAKQPRQALARALVAWRASRDPVIASAIVGLDAADFADFARPTARSKGEFHRVWLAAAKSGPTDDVLTGFLARTLTTKLEAKSDYFGILRPNWLLEKHAALFERVQVLASRPPDPRIARALVDVIIRAPYSAAWGEGGYATVYDPMLAVVRATEDPSVRDALEQALRDPVARHTTARTFLAGALPTLIAHLNTVAVTPPPDAEDWTQLAPRADPTVDARTVERLRREIYDDPANTQLRLVYADLLLEGADPHGEMVRTQLASPSPANEKRARGLLRKHKATWLGDDLATVLKRVVFEGGFLHSAELAQNGVATPERWVRASQDERLGTLRSLAKGKGNAQHLTEFLTSSACRNLHTVHLPTKAVLLRVLELTEPRYRTMGIARAPGKAVIDRIARAAVTSELEHLSTGMSRKQLPRSFGYLERTGLLDRLGELTLVFDGYHEAAELGHPVLALWSEVPPTLMRLTCRGPYFGARSLERTPEGTVFTHTYLAEDPRRLVAALPPDLVRFRVNGQGLGDAQRRKLERALKSRPGCTLEVVDL
jgi:uncharacterized protein (TIGR02996 family)